MKKINLVFYGILLWAVFLAGCAGGAKSQEEDGAVDEEDDIWYAIESAEELNGEWEGLSVLDVPADESKGFPETVFNVSLSLNCADTLAVQRVKIAFGDFLTDLLAAHPDSILTAGDLWEEYFENIYADYDLIREEYALIIEYSGPVEDLLNGETGKLYINQDGTRLREFTRGGLLGGLLEPFGVSKDIEFILEKL
ncbi:MAG: hypothetical protein LBG57_13080 [Treponema sp.]|jgi:hypothetical protein|nr:hypothetical protein [Treponema sp.]